MLQRLYEGMIVKYNIINFRVSTLSKVDHNFRSPRLNSCFPRPQSVPETTQNRHWFKFFDEDMQLIFDLNLTMKESPAPTMSTCFIKVISIYKAWGSNQANGEKHRLSEL